MGKEEQRQRLWQGALKARQGEEEQCHRRQQGETPTGVLKARHGRINQNATKPLREPEPSRQRRGTAPMRSSRATLP